MGYSQDLGLIGAIIYVITTGLGIHKMSKWNILDGSV